MYRKGKHHPHGDQVILGLFAARDELRIEVGGDVFVQDLAFTHGDFMEKYLVLVDL